MKSNFETDLVKEKKLASLLDSYYQKYLPFYDFERIQNIKQQLMGIDLILKNKASLQTYFVDEKAQLDYVNDSLPTFSFELFYEKNGVQKQGWLFDSKKKTDFYALVTSIYADEENIFTSCNITFVNRKLLIDFLEQKGLSKDKLAEIAAYQNSFHGKMELRGLDIRNEGYLFFSRKNKVERPVNLILKLDFLIKLGVAKKLV